MTIQIEEICQRHKWFSAVCLMQNIVSKFELNLPNATKQQIAAITTLLLIDDYHREYVPKHDLQQMFLAVVGNEPSKGFAKSPIERVYEFATSDLIRMPYVCLYDTESASYILGETRGFGPITNLTIRA